MVCRLQVDVFWSAPGDGSLEGTISRICDIRKAANRDTGWSSRVLLVGV